MTSNPRLRERLRPGHSGRPEAMEWCENNGIDYVFGLTGNKVLSGLVEVQADDIRTRRVPENLPALRGYAGVQYAAGSRSAGPAPASRRRCSASTSALW